MIKNNEDAIKHTAEVIHRNYHGEISDEHTKVQLFGVAVYNKLLKYRMDLAKLQGEHSKILEIESGSSKPERSGYIRKV